MGSLGKLFFFLFLAALGSTVKEDAESMYWDELDEDDYDY